MHILSNILTSLTVCAALGMLIAVIHLLKTIKKNRESTVESIARSIKEFIITIAVLVGIEVIVSIIKIFID